MSTTTGLITVAEYERMQDPPGFRLELRHGEVVKVSPPKSLHVRVQHRIAKALNAAVSEGWEVVTELPFRPQAEYEVWVADLAVTAASRWEAVLDDAWFAGAPELIIEVLSPSNTVREMLDREQTCFNGGCRAFWVVDPDKREVHVTSPSAPRRTYRSGEQIPIALLDNASIAVDQIFQ